MSLALVLGLLPTRPASIPMFPPRFFAWPSSVVFACRCGIATRLVACAEKFSTAGRIMPLLVAVGGIGSCAIMPFGMWSAPRSPNSRRSLLSLRNLGSFSLRDPPILVVLPLTLTILRVLHRLPLLVVALPISGSPGVCAAPLRPGTSPSRRCFAPSHLSSASPSVTDVFLEVETWKRAFQDTASLVAERGATFCPLVWRLAEEVGPKLFGVSSLGLPLNPAWPAAPSQVPRRTSVSELHSALAAPFTGKTRVQSCDVVQILSMGPLDWRVTWFPPPVGDFHLSVSSFSLVFVSFRPLVAWCVAPSVLARVFSVAHFSVCDFRA